MIPQLWVFAGPNGAGKSTLVDRYMAERLPVINPDNIARELDPRLGEGQRVLRAGRLAVAERDRLLEAGSSFAIETTLTGKSEIDLMRAALAAGYKVNLVYIGLGDLALSIGRVISRVASGGHAVPMPDLVRRFARSRANLPVAMALAERVFVFDNSGTRRQLLFLREKGRVKFQATLLPDWLAKLV